MEIILMSKSLGIYVLMMTMLSFHTAAMCQTAAPTPAIPAPASGTGNNAQGAGNSKDAGALTPLPNDVENYQGDHLTFSYDKFARRADMAANPIQTTDVCISAHSKLVGKGRAIFSEPDASGLLFQVVSLGKNPEIRCAGKTAAIVGDIVVLKNVDAKVGGPSRTGWAMGTLLIPFKYQIRGDKSFSNGASLGGYAGWRFTTAGFDHLIRPGLETQVVGFLGATTTSAKQTIDGKEQSLNLTGATYGVGLLASIKDSFQIGLVIGKDRFDKNAPYLNNKKTWLAASIGYTFSN